MTSVPSSPSMASVFSGSSRPTKALVQESIREGKPLSVVSPGCMEKAGEGLPRRHPLVGDKELVSLYDDDVTTLYEAFEKSANVFGKLSLQSRHPTFHAIYFSFFIFHFSSRCFTACFLVFL